MEQKNIDYEYITITDVQKILNVSVFTVRRWVREGKLKAYRLTTGGKRRFKKAEVEAMIQPEEIKNEIKTI